MFYLNTKGDDLSELKSLTDSKGDTNSLHKLIYMDIQSKVIRDEIIAYINRQASIQLAHNIIGSKIGSDLPFCPFIFSCLILFFREEEAKVGLAKGSQ